jgi:alditol oxidase
MHQSGQPDTRHADTRRTNWAGNVTFGARRFHRPSSVPELQHLVAHARQVRALGTGHSFNALADSPGDLVSLAGLPRVIEIDTANAAVTVGAGLAYGELAVQLNAMATSRPRCRPSRWLPPTATC